MLKQRLVLVAAALLLVLGPLSGGVSAGQRTSDARQGARWLTGRQETNGAFNSTTQKPDMTAEAVAALVSAGYGGKTVDLALDYIEEEGEDRAQENPAFAGRIAAGIVAGRGDPTDFGGFDYIAEIESNFNDATDAYSEEMYDNMLAMNGLLAGGESLPDEAIERLGDEQCSDGGFADLGCDSEVDTTARMINVLVEAVGDDDPVVEDARDFLLDRQNANGGWGNSEDDPTSSDSTAFVLTAIKALGENAGKAPWKQKDGDNPVSALRKLQLKSGAFRFNAKVKSANLLSTIDAIPGMAGKSYPIPAGEEDDPNPKPPKGGSGGGGGGGGGSGGIPDRPDSFDDDDEDEADEPDSGPSGNTATDTATETTTEALGDVGADRDDKPSVRDIATDTATDTAVDDDTATDTATSTNVDRPEAQSFGKPGDDGGNWALSWLAVVVAGIAVGVTVSARPKRVR